jgi:L-lactate dehydrogenase (cytochrome)
MGRLVCVADYREAARRRLPRAIFDFVDGGAGHEHTLRANEAAFQRYTFRPEVLTDVSHLDLSTEVLGTRLDLPLLLGPSGMQRLVCREGEPAAARAAAARGAGYVLSISSSTPLEEVAAAASGGPLWFQVYLWDTRAWVEGVLERAERAGYRALCVTVDSKAPGGRKYRDMRNGLTAVPARLDATAFAQALTHPRWLAGFLRGRPIRGAHLPDDNGSTGGVSLFRAPSVIQRRMDPSASWSEVAWLRRAWKDPLIVKGVLRPEDAARAFAEGADAVVCSNHGGRLLDGAPASLAALPAIVEVARRERREVYLDGGIRTGGDVVRAIALGARACLIARPFWWGLAVGGQAGVEQVLDLLRKEIESTLTLIGRPSLADLDETVVTDGGPR